MSSPSSAANPHPRTHTHTLQLVVMLIFFKHISLNIWIMNVCNTFGLDIRSYSICLTSCKCVYQKMDTMIFAGSGKLGKLSSIVCARIHLLYIYHGYVSLVCFDSGGSNKQDLIYQAEIQFWVSTKYISKGKLMCVSHKVPKITFCKVSCPTCWYWIIKMQR